MAAANPKITLSRSQDIPFNKLVLSQANVRRVKAGISIEALAEDIARRTLLQSLNVRPVHDASGAETGMYEVPAGGRRFRALEFLVKQKRLARNAPIPCIVRTDGLAEEDSLAENVLRAPLHPLDQFRAFQALRDAGLGEEEIAARFFVSPAQVKQRLKLAAVSPKLLELYAEDEITLEQLMAFTVTTDTARQEQVWEALAQSYNKEPYHIRRLLTEGSVRAADKRARFVGLAAYEAAGGCVMRDLFEHDDGGWLQDPALLDRLVAAKLQVEARTVAAEGWKWVEVATEFAHGHTARLRRASGEPVPLTDEEQARRDTLQAEYDQLRETYAEADELSDEVDQRLDEIETALETLDQRPPAYDPADIARAGAFVSISSDGRLRVERGFVRPEDDVQPTTEPGGDADDGSEPEEAGRGTVINATGQPGEIVETADDDDGIRPLPDRLVTELTAHRTLALRDALANDPDTALLAVLHSLCLRTFYRYASDTCLEINAGSTGFGAQAPGLNDGASARAIEARHEHWTRQLPQDAADLWEALAGLDAGGRAMLLAHCASLTVNALHEPGHRRAHELAHADRLARAVGLDMVAAGWTPTVDNYLGRVTKAHILDAVREAKGDAAAQLIDHLKKPDMAREAERLLADAGWLPEPLRTPTVAVPTTSEIATEGHSLPDFLADGGDDSTPPEPHVTGAA